MITDEHCNMLRTVQGGPSLHRQFFVDEIMDCCTIIVLIVNKRGDAQYQIIRQQKVSHLSDGHPVDCITQSL